MRDDNHPLCRAFLQGLSYVLSSKLMSTIKASYHSIEY